MSKLLTSRQRQVLDALQDYIDERGFAPSIRELQPILGISSLRGVTIHLDALERKGWIHRESTSRSIRILIPRHPQKVSGSRIVPLLKTILTSTHIFAIGNIERYIQVADDLASKDDKLFAMNVIGDAMNEAMICNGDILILRTQESANNGEIVAALQGNEPIIKRFDTKSQPPKLLTSNFNPKETTRYEDRILGKVVRLIRNID